jgi:hypothetical protein
MSDFSEAINMITLLAVVLSVMVIFRDIWDMRYMIEYLENRVKNLEEELRRSNRKCK